MVTGHMLIYAVTIESSWGGVPAWGARILVYAKLGNARRKVNKIQRHFSPLEIFDLGLERVVK